jgi:hypothetical protein
MSFSELTKDIIYNLSGGRCQCTLAHAAMLSPHLPGSRCQAWFYRNGPWEAHHIMPESLGGDGSIGNGAALCLVCHHLIHGMGQPSASTAPAF